MASAPMKPVQVMVPATPADRLRALLDIAQSSSVDIERLSDAESSALAELLKTIAHRPGPLSRRDLAEAVNALRRWFSDLTTEQ
jgi:hypothetical protein